MYIHVMVRDEAVAASMAAWIDEGSPGRGGRRADDRLRVVCNTLRMVTRAMTQLYDDALRPGGLRITRSQSTGPQIVQRTVSALIPSIGLESAGWEPSSQRGRLEFTGCKARRPAFPTARGRPREAAPSSPR